jgi:hypothetical protein
MRKCIIFLSAILVMSAGMASARDYDRPDRPFNISLQGGFLFSVGENTFTFQDNGKTLDLFTPQGAFAIGYDFTNRFGMRVSAAYGRNASAANSYQTAARGFYPYNFNSLNVFGDLLFNLTQDRTGFSPILYAGIGGAYAFGFTDSGHPWQKISDSNTAFGFRAGFIAEYEISPVFGIYADLCGEAYTDNYNGLSPSTQDQTQVDRGYAGFPFDLRVALSFGIIFHF